MTTTDNPEQQDTPAPTVERWAYAGVRVTTDRKAAEVWIDQAGDGDELWFASKGRRPVLGAIYEVDATRTGERISRYGKPRYTGARIASDDPRYRAWNVADNGAHVRLQLLRDEAKAAKRDGLDEALEPLLGYAAACRTRVERDALLATVIRRIAATW
jgi:hypothetical protein